MTELQETLAALREAIQETEQERAQLDRDREDFFVEMSQRRAQIEREAESVRTTQQGAKQRLEVAHSLADAWFQRHNSCERALRAVERRGLGLGKFLIPRWAREEFLDV